MREKKILYSTFFDTYRFVEGFGDNFFFGFLRQISLTRWYFFGITIRNPIDTLPQTQKYENAT